MKTYNFIHKHSSAVLTLSAENDKDANFQFRNLIDEMFYEEFRMEIIEDEEDYVTKHNEAPYGD